ncbi:MAG: NAD(+) diphosphatase [Lentisphaeria bacterium]|nr:NAD(+) diphosphatase [Lentisphaeria bacterium]
MAKNFIPGAVRLYDCSAAESGYLLLFSGDKVVLKNNGLPRLGEIALPEETPLLEIGKLYRESCFAVRLPDDFVIGGEYVPYELREGRMFLDAPSEIALCRGMELTFWHNTHRFCGSCGTPLQDIPEDCGRICPQCKARFYPVIAPAVIVAVTDDRNRLLLAHNVNFKNGVHSLIAGFVETGENLEQAVRRELREEVNIEVEEIRYFGSQSWPHPNSLMLGFTAKAAGGELRPDGVEIDHADFYTPDTMPNTPKPGSLGYRLITDWMKNYRKD